MKTLAYYKSTVIIHNMKEIVFHPKALKDIKGFPQKTQKKVVGLLELVREGASLPPKDFKYMEGVGKGVYELRVRASLQYRVFYVAKFKGAVYVLHAFIKKTQETGKNDINRGKRRYNDLLMALENEK